AARAASPGRRQRAGDQRGVRLGRQIPRPPAARHIRSTDVLCPRYPLYAASAKARRRTFLRRRRPVFLEADRGPKAALPGALTARRLSIRSWLSDGPPVGYASNPACRKIF